MRTRVSSTLRDDGGGAETTAGDGDGDGDLLLDRALCLGICSVACADWARIGLDVGVGVYAFDETDPRYSMHRKQLNLQRTRNERDTQRQ